MKKLSKSGIFILMTVTILLQYVSPILTAAQTIGEKVNLVTLNSAQVKAIEDQDVTIDLKVTANNSDTQAETTSIKVQDSSVVIKEVTNQTTNSKNQYSLSGNVISAEIAGNTTNETNDLSIKLSKDSLKDKATLVIESDGSTTNLDLSQVVQAESAAEKTADNSTASTEATSTDEASNGSSASSEPVSSSADEAQSKAEEPVTKQQVKALSEAQVATDISQYLPDDLNGSIFDTVILSYTDADGNPVDEDKITADTKISFKYNWSIPNELKDNYELKDGDYYEFKLPSTVTYTPGTGSLGDYGDYQIFSDGTVRFTFKNVENNDSISGSFNYSQSSIKTNEPGKIIIDVPTKSGTDTHEIVVKPKGGADISKAGRTNSASNPTKVFWDVTINTSGNQLINAQVSDAFPAGNTYESVEVYPLTIDMNGNVVGTGDALTEAVDYEVDSKGTVTFIGSYADTYQAFKVSYVTKIDEDKKPDDGGSIDFKNTATLTNGDKEVTASNTVTANYGKLIDKKFDGADSNGSQVFNWHIDYNAGAKVLPANTQIVDTLDGDQIFYGTPKLVGSDGKAIDTNLYTITYSDDHKTMTINFPTGLDKQIKITYQSQVTVPIVDGDKVVLKNTATSNSKEATAGSGEITEQGLVKSRGDVDYINRTVQWNLDINKGRQEMTNWSLEDTIPAGLTVDYNSFVFTNIVSNTVLEKDKDYKITVTETGFKVEFLGDLATTTSDRYTLSFKTAFEASTLKDSNKKWTNSAVMNWTDKNGKEHKNKSTADFTPRDDYRYDGSKQGSYNAVTKAITWKVYTNLNQRQIVNGSITDKILEGQEYVAGSAVLYSGSINKAGDVTNLVEVDGVTPVYDEATRTLSVNLPEGSNSAYVLQFDTSLKNQVIDQSTYKNTATYTNNAISNDLNGSTSVNNGGSVVEKTGEQDPTDSAYALWHIWVNKAQSTVKDVVVTDIPSSNQSIIEDSIKVYGSVVDASGNVSKDASNVLTLDKDYSVDLQTDSATGKQELVVKFLNQIDTAYLIEYRAYINSSLVNDVLTNTVNVSATGQKEVDGTVEGSSKVVNNGGSSTAKNVNLVLTKTDKDDNSQILTGVKFELYSYTGGTKGSLLRTGTTDVNGQITWGNLKSGDYILVETSTLTGYVVPTDLANGKKITLKYDGVDVNNNFNLTETNEKAKTSLSGVKIWDDNDNQEGLRPESVKVNLLSSGEIIDSIDVSAASNWSFNFNNLVKYDSNGKEIQYSISEVGVPNYTSSIDDSDLSNIRITNSRAVEKINVQGTKTWDDSNNQDGNRPESISVNLLADGEQVDSKTVTASDNWKYSFENLVKYKNGQEIVYTITENSVAGYSTTTDGYDLTNSYTPGKTSIAATKKWDDNNNQDGIRPTSIEVELYANGNATGKTATLSDANQWVANFTNLDEKSDGKVITYTVKETSEIAGYTTSVDDSDKGNVIITNTHTPEITAVSGTKTWSDSDNQDGIRPDDITVNLLANGTQIASKTVTADDNWQYSFENLPKFENGEAITYTITENSVAGYSTTTDGYDLTNSYTPGKTSVTVTKAWVDNNNQDGIRPTSIKVQLYADGKESGDPVELNAKNNWTTTFDNLAQKTKGKVIEYTVKETDETKGYTETVDDSDKGNVIITNTHTPKITAVSGTKTWSDSDNQDGIRPDDITVNLLANGTQIASKTVTADDNWQYSFENLPKFENGEAITYTITENSVAGYSTTTDGYDLINSYTPGKTSVTVTKAWVDNNNQDGIRPTSIKVQLYADGKKVGDTVELSNKNQWTTTFDNLDLKAAGKAIVYTVKEVSDVAGYTATVSDSDKGNIIITNTHKTEVKAVEVTKKWSDNDDQFKARPDKIQVQLYADGVAVGNPVDVTAKNNWKYTWTDLAVNLAGKAIKYTVEEVSKVDGYKATINAKDSEHIVITNTYQKTPAKTTDKSTKLPKTSEKVNGFYYFIGLIVISFASFKLFFKKEDKTSAN
ncbi:MAG: Cna B-type domain-containing protein [Streptococcaceae bacterium]|nr:Cna B-type domain-containing protein [Streptococcaceae bacterium]